VRPPGLLADLGPEAAAEWSRRVTEALQAAAGSDFLRAAAGAETPGLTATDWTGFPARVAECLTRGEALPLLDWDGPDGPRALQEEYVEWRVVRDGDAIRRVELTTELSDYWRVLAAYEPERTLELVAAFARRPVTPERVYGMRDPLRASPEERERGFEATMLDPAGMSPCNDGRAAICCMVQPTNTLGALVGLAVAATSVRIARDVLSGRLRCLTCDEAIAELAGAAMRGRASDPVLVERFGRLAFEGRLVAFDDPVGVYIAGVEHGRLRTPAGDAVPREWFSFSRGAGPDEAGVARYQRLVFEPPPETGLAVSDLVDVATEQPLRHGGQVAELVQVIALVRVSGPDAVAVEMPDPTDVAAAAADDGSCAELQRVRDAFRAAA